MKHSAAGGMPCNENISRKFPTLAANATKGTAIALAWLTHKALRVTSADEATNQGPEFE